MSADSVNPVHDDDEETNNDQPRSMTSVTFASTMLPPPKENQLHRFENDRFENDRFDNDEIHDHFSLSRPSDLVRFRDMHIHVYDTGSHQMQIVTKRRRDLPAVLEASWVEEDYDGNNDNKYGYRKKIRRGRWQSTQTFAKEVEFGSMGLLLHRIYESLSASIVVGIVFIFFTQFILFLFLSLVIDGGLTSNFKLNIPQFVGTVLSLRYTISAASLFLSIATSFVSDTWDSHKTLRLMMRWKSVWMEWIIFMAFMGVPLTATFFNLLMGVELWWEWTARIWVLTLMLIFLAFAVMTIVVEVRTSLELLLRYNPDTDDAKPLGDFLKEGRTRLRNTITALSDEIGDEEAPRFLEMVRRAVLLRQIHCYCGVVKRSTILINDEEAPATASFFQKRAMPEENEKAAEFDPDDDGDAEEVRAPGRIRLSPRGSRVLSERRGWYARFTLFLADSWTTRSNDDDSTESSVDGGKVCGLFQRVPPHRHHNIDEVLEKAPLVTGKTWSLDRIFCHSNRDPAILIMAGKSSITPPQALSSIICSFLGNAATAFLAFCFLSWLSLSPLAVALGTVCFVCFVFGTFFYRSLVFYSLYRKHRQSALERRERRRGAEANDIDDRDEALFEVDETYRITKPSNFVCWVLLGLEFLVFFLYPLVSLYKTGSVAVAIAFTACAVTSAFRDYINVSVILQELGSLDFLQAGYLSKRMLHMIRLERREEEEGRRRGAWWRNQLSTFTKEQEQKEDEEELLREVDFRAKNHAARIVGHISQGHQRDGWRAFFLVLTAVVFFLFVNAYSSGTTDGKLNSPPKLVRDFRYEPQVRKEASLSYPTCQMREGFEVNPDAPETSLLDYVYLSWMAYARPEFTKEWLDNYFGEGIAVDLKEYVDEFRHSRTDLPSAVHYKLITFPQAAPWLAVVTIRGTATGWDTLTDAQLWMAAVLAQAVRNLLPYGEIWTPVLDEIVAFSSVIGRGGLQRVAFYQQTTAFLNHLQETGNFTALRVMGHSLGGGLAMITGAQSGVPAVAVSGPNAVLSRRTFDPPLKLDDLNRLTFNIVPDFDIMPMIDDLAQNVQRISCRAHQHELLGCHDAERSVCEVAYTCGTSNRPVSCACTLKYGYPEPIPTGNLTFAEACGVDQATVDEARRRSHMGNSG